MTRSTNDEIIVFLSLKLFFCFLLFFQWWDYRQKIACDLFNVVANVDIFTRHSVVRTASRHSAQDPSPVYTAGVYVGWENWKWFRLIRPFSWCLHTRAFSWFLFTLLSSPLWLYSITFVRDFMKDAASRHWMGVWVVWRMPINVASFFYFIYVTLLFRLAVFCCCAVQLKRNDEGGTQLFISMSVQIA